VLQNKLIHVIV